MSSPYGEKPRKLPEFIIVEEGTFKPGFDPSKYTPPQQPGKTLRLRILCFLVGLIGIGWFIAASAITVTVGLFSMLMLFKVPVLNKLLRLYWEWTKAAAALTLGFFVAIFSLYLGLVIIIAYFSRAGENWQKFFFAKMLYPHVKEYMRGMQ